ncbi:MULTISPECIES: hypothetical protein [unclassified Frankia]|uniref:hypothetical protein n=1 Tax=unclassified Frankia TaxID=2632575 RepID=UPI0020243FBE
MKDNDHVDSPAPPTTRIPRASGRTRRPASATDVEQIRDVLAHLRRPDPTAPRPTYRYLTVRGLTGDPRTQTRLRARILVAHRRAAAGQPQTYQPEPDGLTLGIAGNDATDRITALATDLRRIRRSRDWTITIHPDGTDKPKINP